jgi:enoyl-CoA hydratase/carnithine racemase
MGYAGAFALLVAGKPLTAEAALRAHLVNMIVPRESMEKHTLTVAAKLAAKPPRALALSRKLLRANPEEVWQRVEEEARLFNECLNSGEAREAFQAFMHKSAAEPAH